MNDNAWILLSEIEKTGSKTFNLHEQSVFTTLQAMKSRGYVHIYMDGTAEITKEGRAAFLSHQQQLQNQCEQEAKNKAAKEKDRAYTAANNRKQRHHDYFVAAFQVLTAWILGLVAEHYLQIVAFVIELFEKLVSR